MAKLVLVYTAFREVHLDRMDKTEIEEIQAEDQSKLEAAGFKVEDPTWELDDESDDGPEPGVPSVQAPDGAQERSPSDP